MSVVKFNKDNTHVTSEGDVVIFHLPDGLDTLDAKSAMHVLHSRVSNNALSHSELVPFAMMLNHAMELFSGVSVPFHLTLYCQGYLSAEDQTPSLLISFIKDDKVAINMLITMNDKMNDAIGIFKPTNSVTIVPDDPTTQGLIHRFSTTLAKRLLKLSVDNNFTFYTSKEKDTIYSVGAISDVTTIDVAMKLSHKFKVVLND